MSGEFLIADTAKELRICESGTMIPQVTDRAKNSTSPHELPQIFVGRGEVRGFIFKQVLADDSRYVYRVTQPGGLNHYEVFRKIINHRFNCISYPGSKSFGVTAWTCRTLDEAMSKFQYMLG